MEATIQAGEQRLRPIIMTSLAFAFGVLPLATAMAQAPTRAIPSAQASSAAYDR